MADELLAVADLPGLEMLGGLGGEARARHLSDARVAVLRAIGDASMAGSELRSLGFDLPGAVGQFTGTGPWLVKRRPDEFLAVGVHEQLQPLWAPRSLQQVVAIDLSHGQQVLELTGEGAQLDRWLARLVDARAIPSAAGTASRARFVDVPVFLVRLTGNRMLLVADRGVMPYVAEWLVYAHQGAFT
jgi:heterotetrameric sarcosine oxidase gamma subunit